MPGPGNISVYASAETALQALLYNFDIGSSKSKPEHVGWIKQTVLPYLWKRGTGLLIIGFASRSGPDGFNMALSKARAEAISKDVFLSQHGISFPPSAPSLTNVDCFFLDKSGYSIVRRVHWASADHCGAGSGESRTVVVKVVQVHL
jgi:hypothetical protein